MVHVHHGYLTACFYADFVMYNLSGLREAEANPS